MNIWRPQLAHPCCKSSFWSWLDLHYLHSVSLVTYSCSQHNARYVLTATSPGDETFPYYQLDPSGSRLWTPHVPEQEHICWGGAGQKRTKMGWVCLLVYSFSVWCHRHTKLCPFPVCPGVDLWLQGHGQACSKAAHQGAGRKRLYWISDKTLPPILSQGRKNNQTSAL